MTYRSDLPFSRVNQQQLLQSKGLPLGKTNWQRKYHMSTCGSLMAKDTTSYMGREKWLLLSIKQMFWKAYRHMEVKSRLRKGKRTTGFSSVTVSLDCLVAEGWTRVWVSGQESQRILWDERKGERKWDLHWPATQRELHLDRVARNRPTQSALLLLATARTFSLL